MMLSFDYLVDTDELNGVTIYISDNKAITDDPVKAVKTMRPFMLVRSPMLMLTFSLWGV